MKKNITVKTGTENIQVQDARMRAILDRAKKVFDFHSDEQALQYAHSLLQQAIVMKDLGGTLSRNFNGMVTDIQPDSENRAFVKEGDSAITAKRLAETVQETGGKFIIEGPTGWSVQMQPDPDKKNVTGLKAVPKAAP